MKFIIALVGSELAIKWFVMLFQVQALMMFIY